jgi:Ni/Co efflux regulator RcnB
MTARLLLMTGSALLLFAIGGFAMRAQEHEQDQNHRDQDRRDQDRRDQDQRDRERAAQRGRDRSRFDDHDRQVSRDWYSNHHDHPPVGLRDRDRLTPEYESQLREGLVLNGDMRTRIHAVPSDYYRQLPPPARGYRYVLIGGHVCLIDNSYRVHDVIHFELNF